MAPAVDEPEHDPRTDLDALADSDVDLLCRIAERDLDAFELLYRRYARAVYGLALRRMRDGRRAEDATFRAFAAIWRAAASSAPERGGVARWLFTVARNAIEDDADAPEEDDWLAFHIHAAVAELPEPERVPLELAYWRGRSRAEIAELLGLPLAAVDARTRSALARLAVRLEGFRERERA